MACGCKKNNPVVVKPTVVKTSTSENQTTVTKK